MMTSFKLLAALGGLVATVALSLTLFRIGRTNPNGALVGSELGASATALLITGLLVVCWAWLGMALYPILGNEFAALGVALILYLVLMFVGWKIMGRPAAR